MSRSRAGKVAAVLIVGMLMWLGVGVAFALAYKLITWGCA